MRDDTGLQLESNVLQGLETLHSLKLITNTNSRTFKIDFTGYSLVGVVSYTSLKLAISRAIRVSLKLMGGSKCNQMKV
jgi:hypothetical protein